MTLLRRRGDVLLAVLVLLGGIVFSATSHLAHGPLWANVLATAALAALLALRGHAPAATAYLFLGYLAVSIVWLTPPPVQVVVFVGYLAFAYAAGSSARLELALAWPVLALAAILVAQAAYGHPTTGNAVFPGTLTLAAYAAGRNVLGRSRLAADLREASRRAEQAQLSAERRAVAAERRRIAREMHDVVAHSISVMVVQAGGGRRILERDPARAEAAAASIEATGRETLVEMRRLLGVMHPGTAPAELEPAPTFAEVRALCERAGARLQVLGHPQPLPSGLEVGAYRVVQEALQDVARAVPGTHPEVTVEWTPLALSIRIADDRPFIGPELVGVRERVHLYGGSSVVSARPEGDGHQLEVRLPIPQGAPRMIRILIADDQALVRAGFRMILDAEDDLSIVGEAVDGVQAVDMARRLKPDVVLMDIRMPELDGIEATRRIVAAAGEADPVRVLMLTTFDLNEYVYEALRAGASGFLLKDVPPEQLAAGIRVVAEGDALLAPSITKRLVHKFAAAGPPDPVPPRGYDELTEREAEVFGLIARGLSNAEIAAELIVSETTVKTHVARVLMKLGLRDRVQAVVLAYESGLSQPSRSSSS